jgi:DNA-binding transcriptional MocR family regulator
MTIPLPVTQINLPPDFIDLGIGDPQLSLLPAELIRQSAETCFARNDPSFLQYGAEQGNGYFRLALAKFLSGGFGFAVEPDSLFVTSGVSGGLDLICTLFTQPGDTIFVEEPTYFLALRIFADHGLRLVPIPTDEDGLILDALEEKLTETRPKFLYIVPTFQNPSGHTLSQERRERLVTLCQEGDFLIVADEVYHFLNYSLQPPEAFASWTGIRNLISLGSFSKILAPGLRLGWIQAEASRIRRLVTCGLLDSGGGMNPFTSAVVQGILENGELEKHILSLKATYLARLSAMDAALRRYLPGARYTIPQGGYFFWVRLPGDADAEELLLKAKEFKVGFRPGVRFSSQGGLQPYVRLSFSFYESQEIEEGVKRLGQALENQVTWYNPRL